MFNFFKRNRTLHYCQFPGAYWPLHVRAGDRVQLVRDDITYQMVGAHSFNSAADLKAYLQSVIWKPMDVK